METTHIFLIVFSIFGFIHGQEVEKQSCLNVQVPQLNDDKLFKAHAVGADNVVYKRLESRDAFEQIENPNKLYAHFATKGMFIGGLITMMQTSPESIQIFRLLQKLNRGHDLEALEKLAKEKAGFSDQDFEDYLAYASKFYDNWGNYNGQEQTKFIPKLPAEKFQALVQNNPHFDHDLEELWCSVKMPIYELNDKTKKLGLGAHGINTYFSSNCNQTDADLIAEFFKSRDENPLLSRVFKTVDENGKNHYELRKASVVESLNETVEFKGASFKLTTGDYSPLLLYVYDSIMDTIPWGSRDDGFTEYQLPMLQEFRKSFRNGDWHRLRNASEIWANYKDRQVELIFGFIEKYRDPVHTRGEFQGSVSVVNEEKSKKFQKLADAREEVLNEFPWPMGFEDFDVNQTIFQVLDVVNWATSTQLKGSHLPNFSGLSSYKNSLFSNVIKATLNSDEKIHFVNDEDEKIIKENLQDFYEAQIGLSKLYGHGSGKKLRKYSNGTFNFDHESLINPLTGNKIESFYDDERDSTRTVFGSYAVPMEIARVEAMALNLIFRDFILNTLGHDEDTHDDVVYAYWLTFIQQAVSEVNNYDNEKIEWNNNRSFGKFVIVGYLMTHFPDLIYVEETDNGNNFEIRLSKDKLKTEGEKAILELLTKLHIYKATANGKEVKKLLEKYGTNLSPQWKEFRKIVAESKESHKTPVLVQPKTFQVQVPNDQPTVDMTEYEESARGMIKSVVERYNFDGDDENDILDNILHHLYLKDKPYFS